MVCSYTLQALNFSAQFSLTVCVLSQNECFFQGCCACVQKNVYTWVDQNQFSIIYYIQAVNNADAWTRDSTLFCIYKRKFSELIIVEQDKVLWAVFFFVNKAI